VVGNGITEKDVNDRVFPAMQVLSQKMWRGTDTTMSYDVFSRQARRLGESPGVNMRGIYCSKNGTILHYALRKGHADDRGNDGRWPLGPQVNALLTKQGLRLNGGRSFLTSPIPEIGYDYDVTFTIRPDRDNGPNTVLFSSSNAVFKLLQQQTGRLGFSREGYDYWFDYTAPSETWTTLSIHGNHKGTSLFVNGVLTQRLEGQRMGFPGTKDSVARVQTLFFPLQRIGDTSHAFKGYIRELKVQDASFRQSSP